MMIWKRKGDWFLASVDYTSWPINGGETLVSSNTLGSVSVTVKDQGGNDVTSTAIDGAPSVSASSVLFMLTSNIDVGTYSVDVSAPTSDGEMLTHEEQLRVV